MQATVLRWLRWWRVLKRSSRLKSRTQRCLSSCCGSLEAVKGPLKPKAREVERVTVLALRQQVGGHEEPSARAAVAPLAEQPEVTDRDIATRTPAEPPLLVQAGELRREQIRTDALHAHDSRP